MEPEATKSSGICIFACTFSSRATSSPSFWRCSRACTACGSMGAGPSANCATCSHLTMRDVLARPSSDLMLASVAAACLATLSHSLLAASPPAYTEAARSIHARASRLDWKVKQSTNGASQGAASALAEADSLDDSARDRLREPRVPGLTYACSSLLMRKTVFSVSRISSKLLSSAYGQMIVTSRAASSSMWLLNKYARASPTLVGPQSST
mmetsp:Transcript_86257/g.225039  ORF Transcript_86257/g.225039 Transcript_86257/m.225039 type:complete len:211 (+) Transcript_86257:219-851(+)